ncbi:MAP7 domain-containing protein 2-like isoform X2 [Hemitrygon akajei]|uniref:MAP7 domain-containing protein 2-like isoform X2 n=1 Tax=Hemitrygon akajei TaxID=2704970 RepID=UPI003BF97FF8
MAEVLPASPRRSDVHQAKRDDRQRLAKERREERDRSLAVREQQILQKERKARLLYEKQMEERWRKLEEQRQREEQRRVAVEEKRRQRFEEDKERHEAMMRRTLERSQQFEHRQKRWSWGGAAPTGTGAQDGESENATPLPIDLAANTFPPEPAIFDAAASRTGSLLKLSSKPTSPSRDRQSPATTSSSPREVKESPVLEMQQTEKTKKEKKHSSSAGSSATSTFRRSQSPANMSKRSLSPAVKHGSKVRTQSHSSSKEFPTSPTSSGKSSPMRRRPSSNNVAESGKKSREKGEVARQKSEEAEQAEGDTPSVTTPVKEHERKKAAVGEDTSNTKTMAGTTDPEEAAKLLAERRRLARLQKEKEEQERQEQEEAERKMKEELKRIEAEEKARCEEEACRLAEERRLQELECQRRAEEERILKVQQEKELLARLEQQREEAEIKAQEAAERQRRLREQAILQVEQERLERKKRIEEIMKRTRRSDTGETKKEEIKAEVELTENSAKEHQTLTSMEPEVSTALLCLESKQDEMARSAVTPPEAVPDLEVVTATEQMDEQPNSVDESTDEIQSMDVSPMSKDEGISIPEFSPLNEVSQGVELEKDRNEPEVVEDLIDLTGYSTYNMVSQDQISLDDCNKNLIEGQCISTAENSLITSLTKSVEETHIQTAAEL